ncbi:MAG: tyrosine-type recombinase/integrase [Candidatus Rokuibacteriota bacterium]
MARRGDGIYQRGPTWWLDFVHDGKRHVVRIGKGINRTVAREIAGVKRAAILKGEAGIGGPKRADLPFEKAAEAFMAWAEANKRPRTVRTYRQCVDRLKQDFTGRRLGQISPFDLERYKRARLDAGVTVMVNRELACLKTLYNRCRDWGKYQGDNPACKVKALKESPGRLRYLEPEEEAKLVAEAGEPLRTMILVGVYAGLRLLSEGLTLRWVDVDLRRGLVTVQAAYAKSGRTRTVPLNRALRAALASLHQRAPEGAEYVFAQADGSPYRSIRTAFQTAVKHAGLKDVTPHVLRHTFASRLAMAGVDLRTIQELGGWASLDMVQRYSHLSPTHKAEAVERIAPNFPTGFTTPDRRLRAVSGKLASAKAAPVAQVDRAAVS